MRLDSDGSKVCSRCKRVLDLSQFVYNCGVPRWCKDCTREYQAAYRQANRERLIENGKRYYRMTAPEQNAKRRLYHEQHREREANKVRTWKQANRERVRASIAKRKAIIRGASGAETILRAEVFQRSKGICYLCGLPVDPDNWHLEHIIPLCKGGAHSIDNVAVAHPLCNQYKSTKMPDARSVGPWQGVRVHQVGEDTQHATWGPGLRVASIQELAA